MELLKKIKSLVGIPSPDEKEQEVLDPAHRLEEAHEEQAKHTEAAECTSKSFTNLQAEGTKVRRALEEGENGQEPLGATDPHTASQRLKEMVRKMRLRRPGVTVQGLAGLLNTPIEVIQSIVHDLELEADL